MIAKTLKPDPDWQFRVFGLEVTHPQVSRLLDRAELFVKRALLNARTNPKLLVVAGRNGCGKTHVAWRCHDYLQRAAIQGWEKRWWKNRLLVSVFNPWSQLAGTSEDERDGVWRDCIESDFLVLDDVGSETDQFKSLVPTENLRLMLDERLGRFTMITTNISPKNWGTKWGPRVADRLLRGAELVELSNAPSWAVLQASKCS